MAIQNVPEVVGDFVIEVRDCRVVGGDPTLGYGTVDDVFAEMHRRAASPDSVVTEGEFDPTTGAPQRFMSSPADPATEDGILILELVLGTRRLPGASNW